MYSVELLKEFGFIERNNRLEYVIDPFMSDFRLTLFVKDDVLDDELIDLDTGDKFILHHLNTSHGAYIASIKEEIESLKKEIDAKCKKEEILNADAINFLKEYCKNAFGEIFENPFSEKGFQVVRRSDNKKWYVLLCESLPKSKLGVETDVRCATINIMADKDEIDSIIDYNTYFPAYHMNKRSWITIPLDIEINRDELIQRINRSRELADKKKRK